MPIDSRSALRERLRQTVHALRWEVRRGTAGAAPASPSLGLTFRPGDQVSDLVDGEEGVIVAGTTINRVVQPAGRDAAGSVRRETS